MGAKKFQFASKVLQNRSFSAKKRITANFPAAQNLRNFATKLLTPDKPFFLLTVRDYTTRQCGEC